MCPVHVPTMRHESNSDRVRQPDGHDAVGRTNLRFAHLSLQMWNSRSTVRVRAQLESTRVSYKLLSISLRYAVNFPFPFPHDHGDKEKCAGMFMVWMELAGKIPLPCPSRHDEMRVKMDGLPSAAAVPPFLTFFGNCAAITKVVKTRD